MLVYLLFAALPTTEDIKQLPEVAAVSVNAVANPVKRIIHVLNWHYVSKDDYLLDDGEQDYGEFLNDVERVQKEQVAFLKRLKVRKIHYEGLTAKNKQAYSDRIDVLKRLKKRSNGTAVDDFVAQLRREDELQLGSPGYLLMNGEIDDVLPGDDADAMDRANPIKEGKIEFDQKLNEAREAATVQLLLKHDESVLIMGGSHDLTDNLPVSVEYVRVTLREYQRIQNGK